MGGWETSVRAGALTDLITKWRKRCETLGAEGKFWEAGRLSEAADELRAVIDAHGPKPLTTDDAIRDAYERAKRPNPLDQIRPQPWPIQPNRLYEPIPGIYPGTRVAD